jgi:hypothetical protein
MKSYCNLATNEANARLGFRLETVPVIAVEAMLAKAKCSHTVLEEVRSWVYRNIVEYVRHEGYPGLNPDLNEANINDLVYAIIIKILSGFSDATGLDGLRLKREKHIVPADSTTHGDEGFVMVDQIPPLEEKLVLIVEAKEIFLLQAMKQCFLGLKDISENNGRGSEVYGFCTTGESWQMVRYDGQDFCMTRTFEVLFEGMDQDKDLWMKKYSVVIDCMYVALSNGGKSDPGFYVRIEG